jgi:proline-specific peptidase
MTAGDAMATREGYLPIPGGEIWYRVVGDGHGVPLLTLHGGPGGGHDYLEPLAALADERPVVFFDQLGCGRSAGPVDPALWRIERFVDEVNGVRAGLGLDRIHLFGQSWGGWLAIEYMLSHPSGVVSLTLASTSASIPQFVAEADRLIDALPADARDAIRRYDASGDYHHPEYLAAVDVFYRRHLCRLDPWPEPLLRSNRNVEGNVVYETMNGPNEFRVIGNLKDWDRTDRLGEIQTPTLITVGRFDEITPNCARTIHEGIPGSELVLFEQSAHTAHLEETERYLQVLRDFLRRAEASAS